MRKYIIIALFFIISFFSCGDEPGSKDNKNIISILHPTENSVVNDSVLIDLTCDKMSNKSIAVLSKEIIAVQIYEKSAIAGGSKRPGFSLEN